MKKIILSVCLIMAFGMSAMAQADFIIRAGVHSVLNPEEEINTATVKGGKAGWNLGADFRFGNLLFFQPGVHFYSSSLSVEAGSTTIDDFKNSTRVQTLKIPISLGLAPFSSMGNSNFDFVVDAGVIPSFNLGFADDNDLFDKDDLENVNWSGKVGAGLEFGLIAIGAYYEFGFNKIFEDGESNFSIIGATVGLKF